jgi:hypothetical protein
MDVGVLAAALLMPPAAASINDDSVDTAPSARPIEPNMAFLLAP